MTLTVDARLVVLVVVLLLLPRALQRAGIPAAVSALALGVAAGAFGVDVGSTQTVHLLATIGISSLFLFAGMEVDLRELRRTAGVVSGHVLAQSILLGAVTLGARLILGLAWIPAILLALALLTPSTGFILDSLGGLRLTAEQKGWVKTKAIATELVALAALFVGVQSGSAASLAAASLGMVALVGALPWAFRLFAAQVLPWAPRSEFTFLVVLSILAALATHELGVYYLVGAFVVGLMTLRVRQRVPELGTPALLGAVEYFAGFFAPFYFFEAGLKLDGGVLGPRAIGVGLLLLLLVGTLRTLSVVIHRRLALGEHGRDALKVGGALLPTLVFSLVIGDILRERFGTPPWLIGALAVVAVGTTLPTAWLRAEAEPVPVPGAAAAPTAAPPARDARG